MTGEIDEKLFPAPSHDGGPTTGLTPRIWPGVSAASTAALQEILTDNHKKWHVFFNERGFHNHSAHAALTKWSLGVHESILRKSYEEDCKYQRPAFASPTPITKKNWKDHLGDENYYRAYRDFFADEVEKKSFEEVLEDYIFSNDANVMVGANKTQPQMLNRFLAGLLHPMIHTGFGVEFNLPGIFAEGIGQAAVHPAEATLLLPAVWWTTPSETLSSRFASAVNIWGDGKGDKKNVHAFTVLARVLSDPTFIPTKIPDMFGFFGETVRTHGEGIRKYVDQWALEGDLKTKLEELIWTNALIYGVCGSEAPTFNADFFHMHLVTSSVFLSSIFARLKGSSQELFLRSYFAVCLGWYVGRGRPGLDLAAFFKNPNTLVPHAPGAQPVPHEEARPSPTSPHAITPDPWLAIMQSTLVHPDDHLPKLQRALSEYSSRFGAVRAGTFVGTELKGAELIDGTLFIRAAGLTANRLGWVREGQAPLEGVWDRHGFFNAAKL